MELVWQLFLFYRRPYRPGCRAWVTQRLRVKCFWCINEHQYSNYSADISASAYVNTVFCNKRLLIKKLIPRTIVRSYFNSHYLCRKFVQLLMRRRNLLTERTTRTSCHQMVVVQKSRLYGVELQNNGRMMTLERFMKYLLSQTRYLDRYLIPVLNKIPTSNIQPDNFVPSSCLYTLWNICFKCSLVESQDVSLICICVILAPFLTSASACSFPAI